MKSKLYLAKRAITILLLGALSLGLASSGMMPTYAAPEGASGVWATRLSGGRIDNASPTLADLDGDGKLEIITGTGKNGAAPYLAVLEDSGVVKWQAQLDDPVNSSPAVADLDNDGAPEIIVSTGGDASVSPGRGSVIAFRRNGTQWWRYNTTDAQGTGTASGNYSSPTVGDVDNDGKIEVVFGSWDRNIYMLNWNGTYRWHYHVADSIWSTAALADLNKDGYLEIIIGTDISGGGVLPDGYRTTDGGFVLILDKNGKKLARRQMNEIIQSSPAVGDVNGDGKYEIFVGTGTYYYQLGRYTQPYVYGFSVDTSGAEWQLNDLPGWPRPVNDVGISSPALADLDGDGDLEVIIGTGYTSSGALYAWHHTGTSVNGFPMSPKNNLNNNSSISASPTVADVDGDGKLEIVLTMLWDVIVVGQNGIQEQVLQTNYSVVASPAIGDLDNDGQTDVVIGGSHINDASHGYVYDFEYGANSYSANKQPWPMFHRDAQHTGRYPNPPQLSVSPSSIYVLHQYGDTSNEQAGLLISNLGDGSISWSVSSKPGTVTVSPASGTVYTSALTLVTVNVAGFTAGTHSLGNIVINGGSAGSATIPVTLYVGLVYKVYLPTVMRNSQ